MADNIMASFLLDSNVSDGKTTVELIYLAFGEFGLEI